MGDDSVVACFGTKVVNYWNTDFASIPIEVSELMHTVVSIVPHTHRRKSPVEIFLLVCNLVISEQFWG